MACRKLISCSNDFHFSHPPPIWLVANQKGTDSLSYLAKDIFHGLGMSVKNPTGWAHGLLMTWDEMKTDRQRRISQSKGIVERRNGKTRYEGGEGLCHLHPLSITVIHSSLVNLWHLPSSFESAVAAELKKMKRRWHEGIPTLMRRQMMRRWKWGWEWGGFLFVFINSAQIKHERRCRDSGL